VTARARAKGKEMGKKRTGFGFGVLDFRLLQRKGQDKG